MMFAEVRNANFTANDVGSANDVCLAAHWANIASLRHEVAQHHICEANASYRRKAMHHLITV